MRLLIFSFSLAFFLCSGLAHAAIGHLSQVSGLVKVYQAKEHTWVNGRSGISISPGDRVRTTNSGAAILSYEDGSELKINNSSSVQFLSSGYRLRYGNTWVRFVKQGNKFRTITPNAVVSVRGTIYTVEVKRNVSSVIADFQKNVSNVPFVQDTPKAHIASSSLLLSLLNGAGTVSTINVQRGKVAVSTLSDFQNNNRDKETLLTKDLGLFVSSKGVSIPKKSNKNLTKIWGQDFTNRLKVPVETNNSDLAPLPDRFFTPDSKDQKGFKLLGETSSEAASY